MATMTTRISPNDDPIETPRALIRGVQRTESPLIPPETANNPEILVDWLSFTLPLPDWTRCPQIHDAETPESDCPGDHTTPEEYLAQAVHGVADWMGLPGGDWAEGPGRYFYSKRLSQQHVDILYGGTQPGMGIHVQVTGQGCRALEEAGRVTDWEAFLAEVGAKSGNISHMDVAIDDHSALLTMAEIYAAWQRGEVSTHYAARPILGKVHPGEAADSPETIYFGDVRQGVSAIRIYDKRKERMDKGHEDPGPWIRVELVVRHEQADELLNNIEKIGWECATAGAIRQKLDFKIPNPNDTNARRWHTVDWWDKFLNHAQKIKLSRKPATRTITEDMQYLERQTARKFAKVMMAHDNNPAILEYIRLAGIEKLKEGDYQQINEYRQYSHLAPMPEARQEDRDGPEAVYLDHYCPRCDLYFTRPTTNPESPEPARCPRCAKFCNAWKGGDT